MSADIGRFVWFDLTTPDVAGAKKFYSDIIGWKTKAWSGGNYEMWSAGDTDVGGIMPLTPELKKAGTPPNWMGYVSTPSVDSTVQRAQKLGGSVVAPAQDIPDVGRFAVLADPQGAVFAIFTPKGPGTPPNRESMGHFSWAELNTTDWNAAWRFYSELFGWKKTQSMDMGPEFGEYFMFGETPERSVGGMSNAATIMKAPAHWLHYVNVKSVDETAKRVTELGGKILNGPMDIPGNDRIAQCIDPQGAYFAIYSSGRKA